MWLLIAVTAFVLAIALHALLSRVEWQANFVVKFLAGGMPVGAGLIATALWLYGPSPRALSVLLIYAVSCEVYIFLFTMVSSSVSASLIRTLGTRGLSRSEIDALYTSEGMVEHRLEKLESVELIERTHAGWALTRKGSFLIELFLELRRFFRLPEEPAAINAGQDS